MDEDDVMETAEIDLEIAEIGEILERHNINPTAVLVSALWNFLEARRKG